jgi:hypothetical protein
MRKLEYAFSIYDGRLMKVEDRVVKFARCGSSSSSGSTRPDPRFRMGQSVLHFWAGWMVTATNKAPNALQQEELTEVVFC